MGLLQTSGSIGVPAIEDAPTAATLEERRRVVLVERARGGDRDAFELLLERWSAQAFRTAYAILGDEADARDAAQDAFLRAWRELPRLREAGRFDAWFGRILVNRCRTLRSGRGRARVREIHLSLLPEGQEPVAPRGDPAAGSDDGIPPEVLERAFDRLPVKERTLLVLHHLEKRPVAEVAALLHVPVGTAKSRLFAARRALERELEAELR